MVMDHYLDQWPRRYPDYVPERFPTPEEIEDFRKLLERAKKYDIQNNEPDCELDSKKRRLLKLAKRLGVKIDFL